MPYCDRCGALISNGQNYCIRCGRYLEHLNIPVAPPDTSILRETEPGSEPDPYTLGLQQSASSTRPPVISVLIAFVIVGGVIDICMAILLLALSASSFHALGYIVSFPSLGWIMVLLWAALILSSGFSFALAYGIWRGRGWAWTWLFIACIVNLVASVGEIVVGIGLVGIVIYPIIIYYLTRPHVKSYFGK